MFNLIQKLFLKIFKSEKLFEFQPFIHIDRMNNPTVIDTGKKMMLPKFTIKDYSKEKASLKAINYIQNNYPHLKGKINIL